MPNQRDLIRMSTAVERILHGSFPGRKGRNSAPASVEALGILVFESLHQYYEDPANFGRRIGSFNHALKHFFESLRGDKDGKGRISIALELYERYRRRLVERKIGQEPIPKYLGKQASVEFKECLDGMYANNLLAESLRLSDTSSMETIFRSIKANIFHIHCLDPEETDGGPLVPLSGDETYFLTSGMLFDASGHWDHHSRLSDVTNRVHAGDYLDLKPPGVARLLDASVQNGPDNPQETFPLSSVCTVTLMEHEHGDRERILAGFNAAMLATDILVNAAGAGSGVGALAAVPGLLITLAVAIDGEDELGSVVFRADDILTGPPRYEVFIRDVSGRHNGNRFLYEVSILFNTFDVVSSDRATFNMSGPQNLRTTREWAEGTYKIECDNAQLQNIRWSAENITAPLQTPTVKFQGERQTIIHFPVYGRYRVSVTAVNYADGLPYKDELDVLVSRPNTAGGGTSGSDHRVDPR